MLVASTTYPANDSAGATILRVSGRIACVSGGLLIAATLCTCLYLCIVGTPYAVASEPFQRTMSTSQWSKVGKPAYPKSILRQPGGHRMTTGDHHRSEAPEERDSMGDRPSRNTRTKTYPSRGDCGPERYKDSRSCERPWKDSHNSLDLNWSNAAAGFPRLPNRRRHHSSGRISAPLPPGIPMSLKACASSGTTSNRLWVPNFEAVSSTTYGMSDSISSQLLGSYGMEPLSAMLHRGGHIKLGSLYY